MTHSAGSPARRTAPGQPAAPGERASSGQPGGAGDSVGPAPRPRRRAPAGRTRARQLPYWITVTGVVVAVALMWQRALSIRGGTLAVAGIVLAAALARLTLPERRAGMLVSRGRLVDVAVLTALGTGLLVAGLVLPPQT